MLLILQRWALLLLPGGNSGGGGASVAPAPAPPPPAPAPQTATSVPTPEAPQPVVANAGAGALNTLGDSFTSTGGGGTYGQFERQRLNRGPRSTTSVTPEMLMRIARQRFSRQR